MRNEKYDFSDTSPGADSYYAGALKIARAASTELDVFEASVEELIFVGPSSIRLRIEGSDDSGRFSVAGAAEQKPAGSQRYECSEWLNYDDESVPSLETRFEFDVREVVDASDSQLRLCYFSALWEDESGLWIAHGLLEHHKLMSKRA